VNTQVAEERLSFPVDIEHSGIRLTIVVVFIAVWIISFIVGSTLIANDGISLLAVLIGFPVGTRPEKALAQWARGAGR
jgi:hypothetical protein